MVKLRGMVKTERLVLKSVICDRCNDECINMHFDLLIQFGDKDLDMLETICFDCYEKAEYRQKISDYKDKQIKAIMDYRKEGKL